MERGVQEHSTVESLIEVANKDTSAELEVKLLAGKIQTRDIADRLIKAIEAVAIGTHTEEHRLTYTFPDGMRVNVVEPPNIHSVCVNQSFKGLPLIVERKLRYYESTGGRDTLDAPEVLAKFTLRSEKLIKKDFDGDVNDPKAYIRILHRKSYTVGDFQIDFSLVKSRVEKQSLREVLRNLPSHELEIEYKPNKTPRKPADVRRALYTLCDTILGAYLRSPGILLQSEIQRYSQEFKFTGIRFYNIVALDRPHIVKDRPNNILKGYTVTNKADGDRAGLYVSRDKKLLLVLNGGDLITWTGLTAVNDTHSDDFLDGEYIEGLNLFCIFDTFRYKSKDVRGLPLFTTDEDIQTNPGSSRLGCAKEFVRTLSTDFRTVFAGFRVETKLFLAGDGVSMQEAIQTMLDTKFEYSTDGLVFTPRTSPVSPPMETRGSTWMRVYKWKPPTQNTVDFLLKFDGGAAMYDTTTKKMTRQGTLYVSRTPGEDSIYPCETITGEYVPLKVHKELEYLTERDRIPSIFQPSAPRDPEAYKIWVPVNTKGIPHDIEDNRVDDNTIIECSYDLQLGRWNVLRSRFEKTYSYRVLRRPQYGNDIKVADDTWRLIHVPISDAMLRSVVSNPPDDTFEDEAYYRDEEHRGSVTQNLRGFHNRVKEGQYMRYVVPKNTLFEFAVGRAGDLHKWTKAKASYVLGIDPSVASFSLPKGGACVRYLNEKRRGTQNLPKVLFAEGDMTKPLHEQAGRYLGMLFGTVEPSTPYIQEFKAIKKWDVMACQFAIHYACKDEETFKVFINNVKTYCKSLFFGTCLDGKSVYTLLAGKDRYVLRSGGRTFAQFEKKYIDDGEWKPEFGKEIDVYLESTEKAQTEFLVPFERVVELFAEAGFDLQESKTFQEIYSSQSGIALDLQQQEYSFLHRTFAFKRRAEEEKVEEEPVAEVVEVEEEQEEEKEEEEKKEETEEKKEEEGNTTTKEEGEKTVTTEAKPRRRRVLLKEPAAPAQEILYFFSKEPVNKEFSNFYEVDFLMDGTTFKSAEHAYQGIKAKTFNDEKSFQKIVKAKSAQSAKSFGKKVENFDQATWDAKKEEVMRSVLQAKFSSSPALQTQLKDTGDKLIANANPRDSYWGIGTSASTTIAKNPAKWKGQNKLGKLLMELRGTL